MAARGRRRAPRSLLVSCGLVLVLGLLGLAAGQSAERQAEQTHRRDRLELQRVLATLVEQYAMVMAHDLDDDGGRTAAVTNPWVGRPGDPADTARLADTVARDAVADAGALLVDLQGRPLSVATAPGTPLPAADDPGWEALRRAASAARLPVSDLLGDPAQPLVALGVPTTLADGAPALLIGLSHARTAGLQGYVAQLPQTATRSGWVVDGRGRAVAGPSSVRVGELLPLPESARRAVARDTAMFDTTTAGGTRWVVSTAVAGTTGWRAVTLEERTSFSGRLERSGRLVQASLVALLLLSGSCLLVLSRRRESALARAARHDELTGLHNRRGWFERAEQELRRAERAGEQRVLLFVDLDGLKQVNDTLGHRVGDRALADAGRVLAAASRPGDVPGRLGGDEFVLLLAGRGDGRSPGEACARLHDALAAHNATSGAPYELRLSVGAEVWAPDAGSTLDEVVRRADEAMYADKRRRPYRADGVLRAPQPA